MDCFAKCFSKPPPKDDGEWIQPVNKTNKRHVAPMEKSASGKRASRATVSVNVQDSTGDRLSWSHVRDNLDNLTLEDLDRDDSALDESLMKSLAEESRDSQLDGTMGRITMGSLYSECSVSRGLGGFSRSSTMESVGSKVTGILRGKGAAKELLKKNVKKVMFATTSLQQFAARGASDFSANADVGEKLPAITSIVGLGNGFFLTASRDENVVKMHRTGGETVEFVRDFQGHKSGITALVVLDKKGRFLSAGVDNTVILWDSRYDTEDEDDDEAGMEQRTLLATFRDFDRYVTSMQVLNEGSYVRPDDDVDVAMVKAMAKKTALEGAASVQRAAFQREIIECSGSFATLSKNDKKVNVWAMTVTKGLDAAKVKLHHELEHDDIIVSMAAGKEKIVTGDIVGVVHLWEHKLGSFGGKGSWTTVHKFMPWRRAPKKRSPEKMMEQSVESLYFLDNDSFISGTKSGVVRVWTDFEDVEDFEVMKTQAISVKVTSEPVVAIQPVLPVVDPNTREECSAFSVAFTDGRMVSMALYPEDPTSSAKRELSMYHVYANESGINDVAVSDASETTLLIGDEQGEVKTLKPRWNSSSSAAI